MTPESRIHELITLKTIAETLNQSNELEPMLHSVLEKLLQLTGLSAAWIFLSEGYRSYTCVADSNLPPALTRENKEPMRCGTCWCLDRYWDGRLKNAVNILNCKRLEDAEKYQWGDTRGITHHATVPLRAGDRLLGVLNTAAPGKNRFTDDELALLQAVAFQIGGAIERMRLYQAEQRRADRFARLGDLTRGLGKGIPASRLLEHAAQLIGVHFPWPVVLLFTAEDGEITLRAQYAHGQLESPLTTYAANSAAWIHRVIHERTALAAREEKVLPAKLRKLLPDTSIVMAAPIVIEGKSFGALVIAVGTHGILTREDHEVLEAVAEHTAHALEAARLEENKREMARLEERNRLARDLHDSVSQMLFSLSMTAKGTESLLLVDVDAARTALRDMQQLSQTALKEMRALIMQLRPAGLEKGLLTALSHYGQTLGLDIRTRLQGVVELPRAVEEALWRIGQEALSNVSKHSGVREVELFLRAQAGRALLRIADRGSGTAKRRWDGPPSYGLSTMRERAELLGGRLKLESGPRKGTIVEAEIPLAAHGFIKGDDA